MDWMKMAGGLLKSEGAAMQKNAAEGQAPAPVSPTSNFVEAMRQANLERQQAQQVQMQTAPTALAASQGGAMTPIPSPQTAQGILSTGTAGMHPSQGGMVTQGQPNAEMLAAMYRGY